MFHHGRHCVPQILDRLVQCAHAHAADRVLVDVIVCKKLLIIVYCAVLRYEGAYSKKPSIPVKRMRRAMKHVLIHHSAVLGGREAVHV